VVIGLLSGRMERPARGRRRRPRGLVAWSLLVGAGAAGAAEDPWAADALGLVAGVPVVDWRAPHRFAVVRAHEDVAVRFSVRGAGLREVLLQVDGRRGAVVCESTPCDGRATLQVVGGGWHAAAVLLPPIASIYIGTGAAIRRKEPGQRPALSAAVRG